MIKPDQKAAIKKVKYLHDALAGIMMCARNGGLLDNVAVQMRGELRQILRLLGDEEDD